MNKRIALIFSLMITTMTLFSISASASELKFSVTPVLPTNQYNQEHTYFDLMMTPNQKQEITMTLRNDTEKAVQVTSIVHPATTNSNGVVEYGESNTTLNKTAPANIAEIVKAEQEELTIPAKSSIEARYTITMPAKSFDGILAGGITVQEKQDEKQKGQTKKKSLAIENNYAYVVAIVLRETEKEIQGDLKLTDIEPGQLNARNMIQATIENKEAEYINQVTIETSIAKKGSKDVLYSSKKEGMQIAPNTSLAYPTRLEGKELEAGTYELSMLATSKGREWKFSKSFTIEAKTAEKLNKSDVSIKKESNHNFYYIICLVAILVLVIIFLLVLLLRKKKI